MFKKPVLHLILISNALLNVHLASANDAQTVTERQRLESVVNELAYLQTYLQETKSSQKLNVRSRFDYDAFREIQGNYTR